MPDKLSATAWSDLPLGVQQHILALSNNQCARRASKGIRAAFDAASSTLNPAKLHRFTCSPSHQPEFMAAITRVVGNSPSLTAITLASLAYGGETVGFTALPDLLAAGAATGLTTRLQKLTGIGLSRTNTRQLQALQQCTGLTHLDISGSLLADWACNSSIAPLADAFQGMRSLTHLRVDRCNPGTAWAAWFAPMLQGLTQLQHLHLAQNTLRARGLEALVPALSAMPGLQTLNLNSNNLDGETGGRALCAVLRSVPALTHLDLSENMLLVEGATALAPALQHMACLQQLHLKCTLGVAGAAAQALAPALVALPQLHTLDLSGNWLGEHEVTLLQPMLSGQVGCLRSLDLSGSLHQAGAMHALAAALRTGPPLQQINLTYMCRTDVHGRGWLVLGPALKALAPSLQSLQLPWFALGVEGTAAVVPALQALTGLTRLVCTLTAADVAAAGPALMGMRRLKVLHLRAPLGTQGTATLAQALPSFAVSLTSLCLLDCEIDAGAAASALAPALAQARGLVELNLDYNDLGPQAAGWLLPVLAAMPSLRRLCLNSCKIGVGGCMALARFLKGRGRLSLFVCDNGVPEDMPACEGLHGMEGLWVLV